MTGTLLPLEQMLLPGGGVVPATITVPHGPVNEQRTSYFFATLPPEVRNQIFAYALRVSIVRFWTWWIKSTRLVDPSNLPFGATSKSILNLLLSCRRAYNEGLPVLYNNWFHFSHHMTVYLPRMAHLNLIRKLNISITFTGSIEYLEVPNWDNLWAVVKGMRALEKIEVMIDAHEDQTLQWKKREDWLFGTLKGALKPDAKGVMWVSWEQNLPEGRSIRDELMKEGWRFSSNFGGFGGKV